MAARQTVRPAKIAGRMGQMKANKELIWTRRDFLLRATGGASVVFGMPLCARAVTAPPNAKDLSQLSHDVNALLETTPYNRVPGTKTRVYGPPIFAVSNA